jgi:hypothetical protein
MMPDEDKLDAIKSTVDRLYWVITDEETGLIRRVGDIGKITAQTVVDQTALTVSVRSLAIDVGLLQKWQGKAMDMQSVHNASINALTKYRDDCVEAKKPVVQMFYNLLQAIIWSILSGSVIWLLVTRK